MPLTDVNTPDYKEVGPSIGQKENHLNPNWAKDMNKQNEGRVSQTIVHSQEHPSKGALEGRIRNEVMYELLKEWRIFSQKEIGQSSNCPIKYNASHTCNLNVSNSRLEKKQKGTGEMNFNMFYLAKIMSFQHVINLNIISWFGS